VKEPTPPKKLRLGTVRDPSNPFQETPECYTSVSTSTSGVILNGCERDFPVFLITARKSGAWHSHAPETALLRAEFPHFVSAAVE